MKFQIKKEYTKDEAITALQSIAQNDYELSETVFKLYRAFGWTIFMNGSVPLFGGENEIDQVMKNRPVDKVLVIRANRGVSTALIAQHANQVTAVDTLKADVFDKVMIFLKIKNVSFVKVDSRDDFASLINDSYDFIYVETGVDLGNIEGFEKVSDRIYSKIQNIVADEDTELNTVYQDEVIAENDSDSPQAYGEGKKKRTRRTKKEMEDLRSDNG